MKKLALLLTLAGITLAASAQNEFANERFYSAFKKIYADGQNGFAMYKGPKVNSLGTIIISYKTNLMLPGADSGRISVPIIGFPDANFDFKPAKTLEQASQKIKSLAEAVKTAYGKPLYEKQTTGQLKNFTFYNTFLYSKPSPSAYDYADVELYTVLDKGVYLINLKIKGKIPVPVKAKLKDDNNLTAEIKTVLSDVDNFFAAEKTTVKETTQYDTRYYSRTQMFGYRGDVKESSYGVDWSCLLGDLADADESKAVYEKFKTACAAAGISFDAEKTEGAHKTVRSSMKTSSGKTYSVFLSCYYESYMNSVSITVSRYK